MRDRVGGDGACVRRAWMFVAVAAALACALPASALAAAPSNDNRASATAITGKAGAIAGTNVEATTEASEDLDCGPDIATVWYTWTAPATGRVTFTSRNPNGNNSGKGYDTAIQIFTGGATSTTICEDDIDGSTDWGSRMTLAVTAGTTYAVQVSDRTDPNGPGTFTFSWEFSTAGASNDAHTAAIDIGSGGAGPIEFSDATTEASENLGCNGVGLGRSVWFKFTVTGTGQRTISTAPHLTQTIAADPATVDTVIAVYKDTGATVPTTQEACNDDATPGSLYSKLTLDTSGTPQAPQTYLVQVGTKNGGQPAPIRVHLGAPPSDFRPAATTLSAGESPIFSSNGATSNQPADGYSNGGENQLCGVHYAGTLWFKYTAPEAGQLTFRAHEPATDSIDFDTVMAVYTDGGTTPAACNDDINGAADRSSQPSPVNVTKNQQVLVQVGTFGNDTDSARQGNFQVQTTFVDNVPPDTTISSPAADGGVTNDTTPSYTFSSSEAGSTFLCRIYKTGTAAPAFTGCASPYTAATLAEGSWTFEVEAKDAANNTDSTPASRQLTVDTTAPNTTITGGSVSADNGRTNDTTPTFSFTSTEGSSTFKCRLYLVSNPSPPAFAACTTPFTQPSALAAGDYKFEVAATDPAGNPDASAAVRLFTIDLTPPDTTNLTGPASPTDDNTPEFSFASTEAGTFQCRIYIKDSTAPAFSACASPFTAPILADGTYTFDVRAVDEAGNPDASPATLELLVDTGPPDTSLTAGPSGITADSTPTFEFGSTDNGATFECRVAAKGAAAPNFAACTSPFTPASALADGAYTFEVRAKDAANNTDQTAATRDFTVDTTPPDTAIATGPPASSDDTKATFTFSSEAGATFRCKVDGGDFAACTSPFTTGTLNLGQHTFAVTAVDAAGNEDATPATASFTIITYDVDGDGFKSNGTPADCDDADPLTKPGGIDIPGNGKDEDCSGKDATFPLVLSGVSNRWQLFRGKTRNLKLEISGIPAGGSVLITCSSKSCPFKAKAFKPDVKHLVKAQSKFKKKLIKAGTKVTVYIVAPGYIGKVVEYTLHSDKLPSSKTLCLPPGATKAQKTC